MKASADQNEDLIKEMIATANADKVGEFSLTDGRFSGATHGFMAAHIAPEAARGGPIGALADGDEITIDVEEGKPVLVRDMEIDGLAGLSAKDAVAVRAEMAASVKVGKRFEEDPFLKAENAMKRVLTDRGYAWAKVERRADVDLPAHEAHLFFAARPGPKAVIGAVRVEGLGELPEAPVRRALDISPRAS